MNQRLKERLVGAAVLVVIAVIFIPMILTGPIESNGISETNIPDRPTQKFSSKLVPLDESLQPISEEKSALTEPEPLESATSVEPEKETSDIQPDTIEKQAEKELVDSHEQQQATPVPKSKEVGLTAWVIQLGSFSSKENAENLNKKLRDSGFPAYVEPVTQDGKTAYRVRVGPELLRSDADKLLEKIKSKMKLDGIVLSYP